MSKEFENLIYIVESFEPYDWDDEKLKNQAIRFLDSLKVKVPQYVADWYDTTQGSGVLKLHNQTETWLKEHDMTFNQLFNDIKRFGYVVTNDFDEVYIKAPSKWCSDELYLHLEESNGSYMYDTVFKKFADTFERQEAIKLMKELGVDLELKEVE